MKINMGTKYYEAQELLIHFHLFVAKRENITDKCSKPLHDLSLTIELMKVQ